MAERGNRGAMDISGLVGMMLTMMMIVSDFDSFCFILCLLMLCLLADCNSQQGSVSHQDEVNGGPGISYNLG